MKKSSIFIDKKYEEMDWLNRVIAPFEWSLIKIFDQIPETIEFKYEDIRSILASEESLNIGPHSIARYISKKNDLPLDPLITLFSYKPLFKIDIPDDCFIDILNNKMYGKIYLRKTSDSIQEDMIALILSDRVSNIMNIYNSAFTKNSKRCNEIADILDLKVSGRHKYWTIVGSIKEIVFKNKWNIRNGDLMEKIPLWAKDYLNTGNRASLTNLIRLKCMTHFGEPIYSLEETV